MGLICSDMPEEGWLDRFSNRCYFYPDRDCPAWDRNRACGRIGELIPAKDDDESDIS